MRCEHDHKQSTREKILLAALDLIGREGVQQVTTRKIAAAAEVNVAAVNYYFGSKDNVINEALVILTNRLTKSFCCLEDVSLEPEERLRRFLYSYAEATLEHADIFRNFMHQMTNYGEVTFEYREFMRRVGWETLKVVLRDITGIEADSVLNMKIFQLFSSLEFPVLLGEQMRELCTFDYENPGDRRQYVELLLVSLIQPQKIALSRKEA
ncbi:MAG: TetR/AcrR family transcriptional regulator [Sporomusaceae bacterium]|nr:TetR/AcrR family transcriptional regulator [Sporomusaceae bacterium]